MSTITLRSVKGSPLTNNEVDANFSNLNSDKYQAGDSPDFVDTLTDKLSLDTTAVVTPGVGELGWDDGNGTAALGLKGGNVTLQVGQEIVARVYNDSGVALTDGQVVYISGAQGNRIAVKLAKADSESTSAGTLGVVTEPIAIGAEGFITMTGTVNGLDTTGLTAGALVYLSASTAGAYTTTPPTAPNHRVTLGYVERIHATVGSIYVKVDNGYELDELHNVLISSASSGNTLVYDAAAGVWKNVNLTDGTGISITEGPGSITIANTGVTSLTGTADEIEVSASTGGVTLSLPSTISANTTGNAATATTATNQSGGTVNATGITFTGTQIITNGAASAYGATSIRGSKGGWSGISFYDSSNVFCNTLMARSSDGYGGIYNKAENNWLVQWDGSGNFTATANVTAYSDERLKKNWRPVQDNFVEKLAQVKSGIYDRTDMEVTQAGVSAQDMQKLLAETVQTGEDGTLSLAYGNAALVAAIELAKQVVELKKEIELLKAR